MKKLIVVNNPKNWKLHVPGIEITSAQDYLISSKYTNERNLRVFNLCRDYSYQSKGYYVSLLAEARGHKVSRCQRISLAWICACLMRLMRWKPVKMGNDRVNPTADDLVHWKFFSGLPIDIEFHIRLPDPLSVGIQEAFCTSTTFLR